MRSRGMQLRRLAADRRHADRVLEQPAGVRVVPVGSRRQCPQPGPDLLVVDEAPDGLAQSGMRELAREELEEAVELVAVAADRRCELRGVRVVRPLERPHLDLEPVAEALDTAEHADGVALVEAPVQEVDVGPHARVDPAARIDELEREIGRPVLRAQPLLPRDRVDALDDPILGQVGDRVHGAESRVRSGRGRAATVLRAALRRRARGTARLARCTAVRRPLRGRAGRVPREESVQRRPPDPARLRGAGRPRLPSLARRGDPARGGALVLGARTGLRRARRHRTHAAWSRRVAQGRALRGRRRPPARADAPRGEGRAAPPGRGGRRAARADLPPLRRPAAGVAARTASRSSRSRARSSGGSPRPTRSSRPSATGS